MREDHIIAFGGFFGKLSCNRSGADLKKDPLVEINR